MNVVFPVETGGSPQKFNNKLVGVGLPYCPPALPMSKKGNWRGTVCELSPTERLWLWLWLPPVRKCLWATNFAPNQSNRREGSEDARTAPNVLTGACHAFRRKPCGKPVCTLYRRLAESGIPAPGGCLLSSSEALWKTRPSDRHVRPHVSVGG